MNDAAPPLRDAPVFVVGAPRSGTTLAASLLSAHPRIAIAPETHFFPLWVKEHGHLELEDADDFRAFWSLVVGSRRFSYLGVDPDRILERLEKLEGSVRYADVFRALLMEYAGGLGKERWGEKTPAHERHLGTLLDWFPEARVVFMVRDPRAVAASLTRTPWGQRTPPDLHALAWTGTMERARAWRDDPRVLFLRYEELVSDPEAALKEVCRHLDEAFDPAMLEERSPDSSPIVNRRGWAREHLEEALEPITDERVDRWRSVLSPSELASVEHVARQRMTELGYEPETPEMGALGAAANLIRRTWSRVERRVRKLAGGRRPGLA